MEVIYYMESSLKIKDIPQNERPKEKLLTYGAESLSNSELLAIIIRTGTQGEKCSSIVQQAFI